MSLSADILNHVDQVSLGYTAQAYQGIVNSHMTSLRLMLVVYFAFFAAAVMKGYLPLNMRQITKHVLMAFIVFELATNWGSFTVFCYDVFTKGPDDLISALIGGANPSEQLGEVYDRGSQASGVLFSKAGFSGKGITLMIFGLLVFVATILMVGYALFLIILSKLGLAILLSLGPIFIALSLWQSTKGLFQSWLNYLVNLSLIPVMTFALLGLILTMVQGQLISLTQAGESISAEAMLAYLLVMVISTLLFSQVMSMAASLGSGIALSTMGGGRRLAGLAMGMSGLAFKGVRKGYGLMRKDANTKADEEQGHSNKQDSNKKRFYGVGRAYQWARGLGMEKPSQARRKYDEEKL